jgi:hypothetical protein
MMCDKAPELEVLWADGRGHAWFCKDHLDEWSNEEEREIVSMKKVVDGKAAEKMADNKNPNLMRKD